MLKKLLFTIILLSSSSSFSQTIIGNDTIKVKIEKAHAIFAAQDIIEGEYCAVDKKKLEEQLAKQKEIESKDKEEISNLDGQIEVWKSKDSVNKETIANDKRIIQDWEKIASKKENGKVLLYIGMGLAFLVGLAL